MSDQTMKKCPFCGEEIRADAIKCRYCGEFLDRKDNQRPHDQKEVPPSQTTGPTRKCPFCGKIVPAELIKCSCGMILNEPAWCALQEAEKQKQEKEKKIGNEPKENVKETSLLKKIGSIIVNIFKKLIGLIVVIFSLLTVLKICYSWNNTSKLHLLMEYQKADQSAGIEVHRKYAEKGLIEAQYNLAECYWTGGKNAVNYEEALKWYRIVAEQDPKLKSGGNVQNRGKEGFFSDFLRLFKNNSKIQGDRSELFGAAQFNLGVMYDNGYGTEKKYHEAFKWYQQAAENGNVHAMTNLANLYAAGNGTAQDYSEAVKWCRKAAERGDSTAQCNLGKAYLLGLHGIERNPQEAVKWFQLAVVKKLPAAMAMLGACYCDGIGVEQDRNKGLSLIRQAAQKGDDSAKIMLQVHDQSY